MIAFRRHWYFYIVFQKPWKTITGSFLQITTTSQWCTVVVNGVLMKYVIRCTVLFGAERPHWLTNIRSLWTINSPNSAWTPHYLWQQTMLKVRGSGLLTLLARFMGPTWCPFGADRTQVGPMMAPRTLLSGKWCVKSNTFKTQTNCLGFLVAK